MITNHDIEQARFNLIEQQIRPWHVSDPEVLQALKAIHREDFMPLNQISLAFIDTEINLEKNRFLLAPKIEARIMQEVKPFIKNGINILIIGSDLGYLASLLCFINNQLNITLLDENENLLQSAKQNVNKYNYNINILTQNFTDIIKSKFSIIIVTGSVDKVPKVWLDSLDINGIMLAFVGQAPILQAKLINNSGETDIFDTWVAPLPNIKPQSHFAFDNKIL